MHIDIVGSVTIAKEHWVWAGLLILTTIDAIGLGLLFQRLIWSDAYRLLNEPSCVIGRTTYDDFALWVNPKQTEKSWRYQSDHLPDVTIETGARQRWFFVNTYHPWNMCQDPWNMCQTEKDETNSTAMLIDQVRQENYKVTQANIWIKYRVILFPFQNFDALIFYNLLIPRAPGVPRSCQMDGHAISTHKGSWFSRYTCKRHPDRVSGPTLRWFC